MPIIISLGHPIDLGLPSRRLWCDRNFDAEAPGSMGVVLSAVDAKRVSGILNGGKPPVGACDLVKMVTGTWRTPSAEDFYELIGCCSMELTDDGVTVTGPNGQTMSLCPNEALLTVNADDYDSYEKVFDLGIADINELAGESWSKAAAYITSEMAYGGNYVRPVSDTADGMITSVVLGAYDALSVTAWLSDASDQAPELIWESDDDSIAYYYGGQIFANNPGVTRLHVRCPELLLTAVLTVTVCNSQLLC